MMGMYGICLGWLVIAAQLAWRLAICHSTGAYNHGDGPAPNKPNWMNGVSGDTPLRLMSIPGTHDSMALYGGDAVQCQVANLDRQLKAGIRALDIRCRHIDNACAIHHGIVYQHANLNDVLSTISKFLKQYTSEVVLMRLKTGEHTDSSVSRSFEDTFKEYKKAYADVIWNYNTNHPRLRDVRGKIVILQNFEGNERHGIPFDSADLQDAYALTTNWDLYSKWEKVRDHLYKAATGNPTTLYINFLSASTGSFPYFVASGHSNPGTGAPRLATGKTTPGWKRCCPDFPRVDCFLGICTIAFEGTNVLAMNWLGAHQRGKRVGIIMADFPGDDLINRIIERNPKGS